MGKRIGYLRVSTQEQRPDRQIDGLRYECDEMRIEHGVSATAKKRPVFDQLLRELEAGDTLVVWALDRAFRSALDAMTVARQLQERGVHLHVIALYMDTTTPAGRFVYALVAALAEFESDTLAERTREGMYAARRRGKTLGRPHKLKQADIVRAQRILAKHPDKNLEDVAARFGCSKKTLTRALRAASDSS